MCRWGAASAPDSRIKEIVVQDAQPVEYGQVLFRVDTNA
jgi:biotin carboxyl carrier protein